MKKKMQDAKRTFLLTGENLEKLRAIAKACDKTQMQVVNQAIQEFITPEKRKELNALYEESMQGVIFFGQLHEQTVGFLVSLAAQIGTMIASGEISEASGAKLYTALGNAPGTLDQHEHSAVQTVAAMAAFHNADPQMQPIWGASQSITLRK